MASSVDAKLLRTTKFPPEFNQKVDMQKVNAEVMKKWIAGRISEILGNDDDVVIELCFNLIEGARFPDIKKMQIQLTGFLDKDTAPFCKELWKLCLSAQTSPQGVPKELLEAKKLELIQEKIEAEKSAEEARIRREEEQRRERDTNTIRNPIETSIVDQAEEIGILVAGTVAEDGMTEVLNEGANGQDRLAGEVLGNVQRTESPRELIPTFQVVGVGGEMIVDDHPPLYHDRHLLQDPSQALAHLHADEHAPYLDLDLAPARRLVDDRGHQIDEIHTVERVVEDKIVENVEDRRLLLIPPALVLQDPPDVEDLPQLSPDPRLQSLKDPDASLVPPQELLQSPDHEAAALALSRFAVERGLKPEYNAATPSSKSLQKDRKADIEEENDRDSSRREESKNAPPDEMKDPRRQANELREKLLREKIKKMRTIGADSFNAKANAS
ncbi:uncharacterized protein L3040_008882 [Drepanopeziza brunnea f. sp. 'multigermtubi']|uniref:uncharacterized protein n=1 Tax=Drepanopeziza brunnea f. sp. 'multigermtubi' TaxID=698441 RepID=UPI0023875688|nr:hypothetical protein L3040_008882 [Drepanopeziza brunnea f. sp. 'multigermtubi']